MSESVKYILLRKHITTKAIFILGVFDFEEEGIEKLISTCKGKHRCSWTHQYFSFLHPTMGTLSKTKHKDFINYEDCEIFTAKSYKERDV